jgi:hypothetical protein
MFCPKCGQKLIESNQRFCQKCGSEIPTVSKYSQFKIERTPYESTAIARSKPGYTDSSVSLKKQVASGGPGPLSKKCLVFSIVSIALAIAALYFNFGFLILSIMRYFRVNQTMIVINRIIVSLMHFMGLIFGILSKINSKKAGISEPENAVEKVGSVFAVAGLITNAILLSIYFIILYPIIF